MTLWMNRLSGNKQKEQSIKLYQTIEDLPIWNWEEIKKTGNLKWLVIEGEAEGLEELWTKLQDEFQQRVGMTGSGGYYFDKFIELQRLTRDEIIFSCDEYNTKLSKTKVKRKLLEKEFEAMPAQTQTLEDQAIILEIFFQTEPGAFNPKKISTLMWYKYLNEYGKRIEQLQRSQANNQAATI